MTYVGDLSGGRSWPNLDFSDIILNLGSRVFFMHLVISRPCSITMRVVTWVISREVTILFQWSLRWHDTWQILLWCVNTHGEKLKFGGNLKEMELGVERTCPLSDAKPWPTCFCTYILFGMWCFAFAYQIQSSKAEGPLGKCMTWSLPWENLPLILIDGFYFERMFRFGIR